MQNQILVNCLLNTFCEVKLSYWRECFLFLKVLKNPVWFRRFNVFLWTKIYIETGLSTRETFSNVFSFVFIICKVIVKLSFCSVIGGANLFYSYGLAVGNAFGAMFRNEIHGENMSVCNLIAILNICCTNIEIHDFFFFKLTHSFRHSFKLVCKHFLHSVRTSPSGILILNASFHSCNEKWKEHHFTNPVDKYLMNILDYSLKMTCNFLFQFSIAMFIIILGNNK